MDGLPDRAQPSPARIGVDELLEQRQDPGRVAPGHSHVDEAHQVRIATQLVADVAQLLTDSHDDRPFAVRDPLAQERGRRRHEFVVTRVGKRLVSVPGELLRHALVPQLSTAVHPAMPARYPSSAPSRWRGLRSD